ncbi:MAG: hypothetical protein IT449_17675 [Phycisphaerales bacterium]|nr:hypothetical protein [Phycisphaerales bacterium]
MSAAATSPALPHREPLSAPILFWGLLLLGTSGLAPAILLPQWRAYESMCVAEQREQHRHQRMAEAVAQERRLLDGLRTDPALVERVAQRDLSVQPVEGDIVAVAAAAEVVESTDAGFVPAPVPAPTWMQPTLARLPSLDYDAVFCEPPTRTVIIVSSLGVICTALMLYGRSGRARPASTEAAAD